MRRSAIVLHRREKSHIARYGRADTNEFCIIKNINVNAKTRGKGNNFEAPVSY